VNLLRFILSNPQNPPFLFSYPVTPAQLAEHRRGVVALDPRLRIPYTVQYSMGIERQVTAKSTFSATYIGSRGIDLFRSRDINARLRRILSPGPIQISGRSGKSNPKVPKKQFVWS